MWVRIPPAAWMRSEAERRVVARVNGKDYPRYFFTQVSDEIRRLFCATCRQLRIRYTRNNWKTVSIARAPSVALLDAFVGPKT